MSKSVEKVRRDRRSTLARGEAKYSDFGPIEGYSGYYQRKLHQIYHSFIKEDQGMSYHVPYIYLYGTCYTAKRL